MLRQSASPTSRGCSGASTPVVVPKMRAPTARERSGFLPQPQPMEPEVQKGFRGGRALFIFFLVNAVPVGYVVYYIRDQRAQREEEMLMNLPVAPEDIAAEALSIVRTSPLCFCLLGGDVVRIDPHTPEPSVMTLPQGDLPLMPGLEKSPLTDIFMAERPDGCPLSIVHFALPKSQAHAESIRKGERKASLLYSSLSRGAYCVVEGTLSFIDDPELRRHYWRRQWAATLPFAAPMKEEKADNGAAEELSRQPWECADYALVRLTVSGVSLRQMVADPQCWQSRNVKRLVSDGEKSAKWIT